MAIKLRSADSIAKKFANRAAAAAPEYTDGVRNPSRSWAETTAAAETTYAAGVQQSIANGSFGKGVRNAGDEKWQRKAQGVGAQRYPQGVQNAAGDYQKGVQPFLDVIANTTLPPRMPKGDPANIQRAVAINQALRAKKLAGA